jgi:SAM-dependent methyltransferase
MERVYTDSKTAGSPVVYAGRFAGRIAEAPDGWPVLSEWDVLPARLAGWMEGASALVVADLFSFPFEAMTNEQWGVPMIVVLPRGFDAGFLKTVFGPPLFERLTFFDCVVTLENSPVLEELRRRYHWTEGQLIEVGGEGPEEAVAEICALLEAEPDLFGSNDVAPGLDKATHRAQSSVLEPQFAAARGARAADVPFDVLEVGCGTGRWAFSFDLAGTRFFGLDAGEERIASARANFPAASFDRLGHDLLFPHQDESFDLVFCVEVMHYKPAPAKLRLLSEMWRVARPGGRLLFLEDFVAGGWPAASTVYPTSVLEFVDLLLEATNGQIVLEHVESLRYPREDITRAGVIVVSRLGVPKRW